MCCHQSFWKDVLATIEAANQAPPTASSKPAASAAAVSSPAAAAAGAAASSSGSKVTLEDADVKVEVPPTETDEVRRVARSLRKQKRQLQRRK